MKKTRLFAAALVCLAAISAFFAAPAFAFQVPGSSDAMPAILLGGMLINRENLDWFAFRETARDAWEFIRDYWRRSRMFAPPETVPAQ